jgi:putative ABC transport system permease protein
VRAATAFRFLPGHSGGMVRLVKPEGHDDGEWRMPVQEADESFFAAFEIELLAGRTFSPANERDRTHSYILNEKAVHALGWTVGNAVGRRFGRARSDEDAAGTVIGVVRDFHYASLREPIEPAAIAYRQWFYSYLGLRISGEHTAETLAFLEKQWRHFMNADRPFTYSFLDEEIDATDRAGKRLRHTIVIFSSLAIFLASLGLFGLVSFSAQQRTREIGIRKVLGAVANPVEALQQE